MSVDYRICGLHDANWTIIKTLDENRNPVKFNSRELLDAFSMVREIDLDGENIEKVRECIRQRGIIATSITNTEILFGAINDIKKSLINNATIEDESNEPKKITTEYIEYLLETNGLNEHYKWYQEQRANVNS